MTREEYIEYHKEFCEKMAEVTWKKNHDYSGGGADPFSNFRQIGNLVQTGTIDIVSVGFLTRMSDKFSRVGSYITNGKLLVEDESVEDTLHDLANYCALFSGYLKEKRTTRLVASSETKA